MPAFRPCTAADAAIIRRDLPRVGGPTVARHLSAIAKAEGRPPVSVDWVYLRADRLGVPRATRAAMQTHQANERAMEVGRLHAGGLSRADIMQRTGLPLNTVSAAIRRYYTLMEAPREAWHRRGQWPDRGLPSRLRARVAGDLFTTERAPGA